MSRKSVGIVTINPYSQKFYLVKDKKIKSYSGRFSKKFFYISFLNTRDLIISHTQISKNIPDEDVPSALEIKVYDELDLDQTQEYKMDFCENHAFLDEKYRHFTVFLTEPLIIENTFAPVRKKIAYIDYIVPAPTLFKTLYTNDILDGAGVDVFIYLQRNDAFLAFYRRGYLLYAKSLKYSFEEIAQRYSELSGTKITVEEVMNDLGREGLKVSDLDKLQHYMQIFSEMFMHINDILIYVKRQYQIDIIDHIYISSEVGYLKGVEEYSQTYLTQECYGFDFDYGIERPREHVEDLHYLMALTARDIVEKKLKYPNFTLYPRPQPFYKRPSGQLILVSLLSLILGAAYPLYTIFMGFKYRYEATLLQKRYEEVHAKRIALEARINALKKEIEKLNQQIELKKKELEARITLLKNIYNKKVNYIMKSVTIADLSQDLVNHKIRLVSMECNDSLFELNVTAKDEKFITRFIKDTAEKKFDRYDISTNEINKTKGFYNSLIKVKVK
ncbi:MAG: hypothetical protein GXO16_05395 [Epsilonproteobacteria bacterium]|nr:hypothetical protein [Campylobacterota bacterium]